MRAFRFIALGGAAIGFLLSASTVADTATTVRALVVSDTSVEQHARISTKMAKLGWTVGSATALEVARENYDELTANWDLIWVPAVTGHPGLRLLAQDDGALDTFSSNGGYVVLMGIRPDSLWLDLAPGGADGAAPSDPGTVFITAGTHPMVTGIGTGGVQLLDEFFDPFDTGGNAVLFNLPDGTESVVQNASGPVVVEYRNGAGHVWLGATDREDARCGSNLLLYIQSTVQ